MRNFIDIARTLTEGDVVDLGQHKTQKAFRTYLDTMGGIVQGERNFFASGKFAPFGKTYIESGFDENYRPTITLSVHFRDYMSKPEARILLRQLRTEHDVRYFSRTRWAKGSRPKDNPEQEMYGPWIEKVIDVRTTKELFANREHSPYGTYQPSSHGFRTAHRQVWDDRGVGFNLMVGGWDSRRGDKYGNDKRQEYHIIDDDKDMAEVANMFAIIQRARMTSV